MKTRDFVKTGLGALLVTGLLVHCGPPTPGTGTGSVSLWEANFDLQADMDGFCGVDAFGQFTDGNTRITVHVNQNGETQWTQEFAPSDYDSFGRLTIQVPDDGPFEVAVDVSGTGCNWTCCSNLCPSGQGFGTPVWSKTEQYGAGDTLLQMQLGGASCTGCQATNTCRVSAPDGTGGAGGMSGSGGNSSSGGSAGDSAMGGMGGTGDELPACENLAFGAGTAAETTFSGYAPERVNDGDRSTELGGASSWANHWAPPDVTLPQWFEMDFGQSTTFRRIELYTTATYPVRDYDVSYWDGEAWEPLLSVTDNTDAHRTHVFDPVTSSKLRILGKNGPEHQFIHVRLNEIEVYDSVECQ